MTELIYVAPKGPRLSRTRGGQMIHRHECRYAQNGFAWLWADDKTEAEIAATIIHFGYDTCRHCNPIGGYFVGPIETEPPLPPCRHCVLAVELRDDGQWWHRSLNRRQCSSASPNTTAEPDPRYYSPKANQ